MFGNLVDNTNIDIVLKRGNTSTTKVIGLSDGTAALPTYTFASGMTNGLYLSAANTLGFTANGVSLGTWTTGLFSINAGDVSWSAGVAVTAARYSISRDADATNQLHFNVPTGAGYEFSVNDVAVNTLTTSLFNLGSTKLNFGTAPTDYAFNVAPATYVVTNGNTAGAIVLQGNLTEGTAGAHVGMAGVLISPLVLTNGAATTSRAYSLYVSGSATGPASSSYGIGCAADIIIEAGKQMLIQSASNTTGFVMSAGTGVNTLYVQEQVKNAITPAGFTWLSGAHTAITTTAESTSFKFDFSASKQWATGTIALQREVRITPSTYTAVASSVMTQGITVSISGAPSVGTNMSITQPTGLFTGGSTTQRTAAAAAATWVYRNAQFEPITVTLDTDTTTITSAVGAANVYVGQGTLTNNNIAAQVFSNAASLYIAGAWTAGANMTITNNYAIFSDAGLNRFDGGAVMGTATALTAGYLIDAKNTSATNVTIGVTNSNSAGYAQYAALNDLGDTFLYDVFGSTYATAALQRNSLVGAGRSLYLQSNASGGLSTATINFVVGGNTATPEWVISGASGSTTFTTNATSGGVTGLTLTPGAHTGVNGAGGKTSGLTVSGATMTFSGGVTAQTWNTFNQPTASGAFTVSNGMNVNILIPTVDGTGQITNTVGLNIGSLVTGSAVYDNAANTLTNLNINTQTVTLNGTTALTGTPSVSGISIGTITVAKGGASAQANDTASLYIASALSAGAGVTLTRSYALWVDAGLTRLDGGVAFGTSSQSTLANYEENTFTPTVTLVGGAGNTVPVYSTNTGRYTRIGNRVFADVYLTGDGGAEGAGTGTFSVAIPIASNASHPTSYFPCGFFANGTAEEPIWGQIAGGGSVIDFAYEDVLNNFTVMTGAEQNNVTRTVRLKFSYEV